MTTPDKGQVTGSAAEIYEEFFVPALFQEWTARVVDQAQIISGQRVLDIACGTGVLSRTALNYVGNTGSVVGVDINEGMLAVARNKHPDVEWKQTPAESLPFDTGSFDAVISQFGLMFFENRTRAIEEMIRVLRPDGKLVIAVWDTLENTAGYLAMVDLLQQLFGDEAANGLRVPYNLGDVDKLKSLFQQPKLKNVKVDTQEGYARFPSLEAWIYTDIKGWVLADMIDDEQYARLLKEARTALASFVADEGSVVFKAPAHIVSATKI